MDELVEKAWELANAANKVAVGSTSAAREAAYLERKLIIGYLIDEKNWTRSEVLAMLSFLDETAPTENEIASRDDLVRRAGDLLLDNLVLISSLETIQSKGSHGNLYGMDARDMCKDIAAIAQSALTEREKGTKP